MQLKLVHPECLKVQPCSQEHLEGGGLGGERVSTLALAACRWTRNLFVVVCSLSVVLKAS